MKLQPSFIREFLGLFTPQVVVGYGVPETSLRVLGADHRDLCRWIGQISGVSFTRNAPYFWLGNGVCAEFELGGWIFRVEGDLWDGALWIELGDGLAHPHEIETIRFQIENESSKTNHDR